MCTVRVTGRSCALCISSLTTRVVTLVADKLETVVIYRRFTPGRVRVIA